MTLSLSRGAVQVRETAPAPPPATRCLHHIPVCFSSIVKSSGTIKFSPTSIICTTGRWVTGLRSYLPKGFRRWGKHLFPNFTSEQQRWLDHKMSRGRLTIRFIFILYFHNHQYQSFYTPVSSQPVKGSHTGLWKPKLCTRTVTNIFFIVSSTWLG